MSDRLIIQGLEAQCRIGVTDGERATPQPVLVDLELAIDAAKAARRDDVRDAVDYAQLVQSVTKQVQDGEYHLMETLAEEVAGVVLKEFRVSGVVVTVKKRALPGIEYAAVEIGRSARH